MFVTAGAVAVAGVTWAMFCAGCAGVTWAAMTAGVPGVAWGVAQPVNNPAAKSRLADMGMILFFMILVGLLVGCLVL